MPRVRRLPRAPGSAHHGAYSRRLARAVFAPALDRNHERPASLLRASQHKRGSRGAPPVGVQSLV